MYKTLWKFNVNPEHYSQFEEVYGPDGRWAELFRRADGYLGTELLREVKDHGSYVTIDTWRSHDDFEAFKSAHQAEYLALDEQCEALTAGESQIGDFATV